VGLTGLLRSFVEPTLRGLPLTLSQFSVSGGLEYGVIRGIRSIWLARSGSHHNPSACVPIASFPLILSQSSVSGGLENGIILSVAGLEPTLSNSPLITFQASVPGGLECGILRRRRSIWIARPGSLAHVSSQRFQSLH
jgi:hypothetical protein